MRRNEDNVIEIGFTADVEKFVNAIRKKLSDVKDWGIADSFKDEINEIEEMISGLSKSFAEGMSTKLDPKAFANFRKKINNEVNTVSKRVDVLEETLQGLVMTFDSADSSKFRTYLSSIGGDMRELKDTIQATVETVQKLEDIVGKSNGKVQFVDDKSVKAVQKEADELKEILRLREQIASIKADKPGSTNIEGNFLKAKEQVQKLSKELDDAQNKLSKFISTGGTDEATLTNLQKNVVQLTEKMVSLSRESKLKFGENAKELFPTDIKKVLDNAEKTVSGFYERVRERQLKLLDNIGQLVEPSALSVNKKSTSLTVPLDISTSSETLTRKAIDLIDRVQPELEKRPLEISFTLTSKYSSKKTNQLLKKWQKEINDIDDDSLRAKFNDLYNTIAKDFQKPVKIQVTSDVKDEGEKVQRVINEIKSKLQDKIHIFPKLEIEDTDIAELQGQLDSISKQLKLNVGNVGVKKGKKASGENLEALTTLSQTLEKRLDNINKNYLGPIKSSLVEILNLAKTLNSVSEQADLPIIEIVEAVKELTVTLQKTFGLFSKEDMDSIFERMRVSIAGINGDLRGGDNNKLVLQLKEILGLYKQYKEMGGANTLSDLGGAKNVQKWLSKHAGDEVTTTNPFVAEGKNGAAGYAEGIRAGIPEVREAAKEMVEAGLEAVRAAQESHSPSKRFRQLGKDGAAGYVEGFKEQAAELKAEAKEMIDSAVNQLEKRLVDAKGLIEKGLSLQDINSEQSIKVLDQAYVKISSIADEYQISISRITDSLRESSFEQIPILAKKIQDGSLVPNTKGIVEFNAEVTDAISVLENLYGKTKNFSEVYRAEFDMLREGYLEYGILLQNIIDSEEKLLELERIKSNFTIKPFDNRNSIDVLIRKDKKGEEYITVIRKTDEELKKLVEDSKGLKELENAIFKDISEGNQVGVLSKIKEWKELKNIMNEVSEATAKASSEFKELGEAGVESQQKIISSAEETKNALNKIAEAFTGTGKLQEIISPVSQNNWSSLNRARKNPKREDRETAENIQNFIGMYMKTGQTEMLSVIRDYIDSSNLKETLKKSLHRTFTEAINGAEKAVAAKNKKKPETTTVTMTRKELEAYYKKYAVWKDSEDFNYNFKRQLEAMQKDGRAFREQTKSGRWKPWQYQVEVPVNQIKKNLNEVSDEVEKTDKKVSSQKKGTKKFKDEADSVENLGKKTKETNKALSETESTPSPKLQKHIDKYRELAEAQQEISKQLASMTNAKGEAEDQKLYKELQRKSDLLSRQMQKESDRVAKNFKGANLKELALGYDKASEASKKEAKTEQETTRKITKSTQQKIDKYKEYQKQLNSINEELSNMKRKTRAEKSAYNSKQNEARQIELAMNALVESARKKNKVDLLDLVGSTSGSDKEINKATKAIDAEGKAAKKAAPKKEAFAKANKKVAAASKEAGAETAKETKTLKEGYEEAEKYRERVLREEQKYRRAITKQQEKEAQLQQKQQEKELQQQQKNQETARKIYERNLNSILGKLNGASYQKNFIDPFQNQIDSLKEKTSNLLQSDDVDVSKLREVREEFQRISAVVNNTQSLDDVVIAKSSTISNLSKKIKEFVINNTAMSQEYRDQLMDLVSELDSGGQIVVSRAREIGTSFNNISGEVTILQQRGLSFTDMFFKQLKSMNAQLLATYFSIYDIIRYFRTGFRTVAEIDSAITELRKVSDATDERLAKSFQKSAETAKELGDTISDVISVTADWARLGYSVDDAEKLARITTLFRTVGDNMSAEDSSSYLISTLKGFGKAADEAEHIVDVYNEVANNWAIDTKGIGEALQRSAASFYAANTSVEKSVALITATNTVLQDPASVGTLWKTLSARIRGAKTELKDLGEEEDEFTKTTSKLRNLVMKLTGFDILEDDLKTYKDIYEIILGIGKAWENLSDIEQASLAEALAGKRNSNALLAVLNNLDILQGAYESALEAEGSAQKEQERYTLSLQYSIDRLKAAAQDFWNTFIDSKGAKLFIDLLTKIVEILTKIADITHGYLVAPTGILLALFGMHPREFLGISQRIFDLILSKLGFIITDVRALDEGASRMYNLFKALKLTVPVIAAALAINIAVKVWEHFNVTVEETQAAIDEITGKISDLNSKIKELQDLDSRTPDQESRLALLREELKIQERLLEIENRRKVSEMFTSGKDSIVKQVTDAFDKDNYSTILRNYQEKWVRSDEDGKNKRTFLSDVMDDYDSDYKKFQKKLNKYDQEMSENAVNSSAWKKASENYKKTQKEIQQRNDSLEKAYEREYEYYLQFSKIVLDIKELRNSFAEDDPIQKELKKWQLIYENQLAQMRNPLIRARERLGMSTDDLTLGSRLHTSLIDTVKGDQTQLKELIDFTKNFTDEQKEAWIVVTKGAVNAKDAIDKWNKSLKEANNSTKFLSIDSSVLDSVTGINTRLKAQFDELASAYDAIFNGDNGFDLSEVDNDLLNSISETFVSSAVESELLSQEQATAAAEKFTRVLTDQKSTAIDVQNAFNELATSYFYAADGLKELNEENAEAIKQQLKKLGVKNADQVVDEYIRLKVDPDGYNKIKREVGKQMQEMEEGGTVDLHVRPVIDTKKLIEKEWNKVDPSLEPGGVATIFSSTFANEAGNVAINVTPILPNGEVLTPDELENYANMILEGVDSDEIPDIQLGAKFTGADAIEQAEKAAVKMHELQDVYYDLDEILLNITKDTFEESEARLKAAGVANAHALAVEFLNANLEAEALQEEAVKAATTDMAGETVNASESFIMEAQMSNLAKVHLADLVAAQTVFNQQGLDVDEKIAALSSLATAYFGTAAAAKLVEMTNNRGYEHSYTLSPEEAWKQIIGDMAKIEMPTIDFSSDGKNTKGAGGAGKDAADAYVEAYEKELKKLEDMRDRGLISEKEYLNRLKDLIDKYFKDREKYAEKYAEELKKYMDQMLSYYNSIISGVTTLLDKRINALQKNKDTTVDALNEEKDAAEERYQAEIDGIQDELDAIEDQQDALDDQIEGLNDEIDKYQDMIDAINEANDAREREINLQKAQYELQRAQNQRTKLVYTGEVGQMRYERDESAVREAKENVKKSEDEIAIAAIEKQIKLLEDEIALIEKQKEELEDQAKALQKQQEAVQKQLDETSKYYDKLIKQQEKFYDDQLKALEATKSKWEELAAIEEVSKAWGLVSDEMTELGFTVEDVLNDVPGAFDAFKDRYIAVLEQMHSGDQGFLDGLKQNVSEIPTEFGKITTAASEAKQPLSDLSTAADTASTKVSTLGTSASTASTGVSSLKTASEGISDNLNSLNEVASFEGLTEALTPVEEALSRIKELLGGVGDPSGNSISGAIAALNTLKLDEVKTAFEELAGAISGVVSALNGGGGGNVEDLPIYNVYRNNGFGEGAGTGGGGLVSAIQAVKSAAENYIGTNSEEAAENTIGSFVALLEAIKKIIEQIGEDTETESTLLSSISIVSDVSQEAINGEDGAVSAFNDLKTKIDEVTSAARELLDVLKEIAAMDVKAPSVDSAGHSSSGTAGAQGNPNVKTSGRSLVGELGPEVVVRGDKYRVVGTDGPEFVNLKKGDIVLNSKQTKELFEKKKDGHGKAFAEGSGFTSFNFTDSYNALLNKVKAMDIPTMSEIKTSIDTLTRTVQSEIKNITTTKTNVTQNNTFNISGVTGEEVAEKINNTLVNTFSGMSLNAYQRSMA